MDTQPTSVARLTSRPRFRSNPGDHSYPADENRTSAAKRTLQQCTNQPWLRVVGNSRLPSVFLLEQLMLKNELATMLADLRRNRDKCDVHWLIAFFLSSRAPHFFRLVTADSARFAHACTPGIPCLVIRTLTFQAPERNSTRPVARTGNHTALRNDPHLNKTFAAIAGDFLQCPTNVQHDRLPPLAV